MFIFGSKYHGMLGLGLNNRIGFCGILRIFVVPLVTFSVMSHLEFFPWTKRCLPPFKV